MSYCCCWRFYAGTQVRLHCYAMLCRTSWTLCCNGSCIVTSFTKGDERPATRPARLYYNTRIRIASPVSFRYTLWLFYLFWNADIKQMTDLLHIHLGTIRNHQWACSFNNTVHWCCSSGTCLMPAFATNWKAFHFKGCKGFNFIVLMILIGTNSSLVELGGQMFSVTPFALPTDYYYCGFIGVLLLIKSSDGLPPKIVKSVWQTEEELHIYTNI